MTFEVPSKSRTEVFQWSVDGVQYKAYQDELGYIYIWKIYDKAGKSYRNRLGEFATDFVLKISNLPDLANKLGVPIPSELLAPFAP